MNMMSLLTEGYCREMRGAPGHSLSWMNFTRITYPMPLDVLILRENELEIVVKRLNPAICVTPQLDHVEILVGYA